MKHNRSLLAAVLTLSLIVAGFGSFQMKKTVSAAAKKTITVKADDFTIKLPASWKNKYVMESHGKKKQGSYVSFSAKKCYGETGEGFLFAIMRYRDDSYMDDLPMYELVGRWNGMNYVAVFPTDIQTMGASKAAVKQYRKLDGASYDAAFTIRPVKKTGKNVYRVKGFSLKLPASWKGKYIVETGRNNSYMAFYGKKCYNEGKFGWLFSVSKYKDKSYQELPAYELVGMWNGVYYVAAFPTDVQYEGVTKKAAKQYRTLNKSVEKVVRSIER